MSIKKLSISQKMMIVLAIIILGILGSIFTLSSISYSNGVIYLYSRNSQELYKGSILKFSEDKSNISLISHDFLIFTYKEIRNNSEYYWIIELHIYIIFFTLLFFLFLIFLYIDMKKKKRLSINPPK